MYSESEHICKASPKTLELYMDLKKKIINLGDVEIAVWQKYVAFKRRKNFCGIKFRKDKLRVKYTIQKES